MQSCLISHSCSSVQTFAVWLTSVLGSLQTTLPLANASDTTPCIRDLHSLDYFFMFLSVRKEILFIFAIQGTHKLYKKLPKPCKFGAFTLASASSSGDSKSHELRHFFHTASRWAQPKTATLQIKLEL